MEIHVTAPRERVIAMRPANRGYYEATVEGLEPGGLYYYRLNGERDRPDPASRSQPAGVHGPSEIVSPEYEWHDGGWRGIPIGKYIIYELHVGAFSREGTFEGVIPFLDELRELGITAIEIMPVAQFPGSRNWGYDGVYQFAPQSTYGSAHGLKRLVDACHARGLAAILDVVYNHLGPEGNYFREFGPYFTDRYKTPWGSAMNFDGCGSDEVRRYYLENVAYWLEEFHFDALRLDAVHAIYDFSARPLLEQIAAEVRALGERLGREVLAIPESDLNDSRLVLPAGQGGMGFPAQWSDDFHHALHGLLTGESIGYYADFGELDHLAKAFRSGFVYTGEYSVARGRSHGNNSERIEAHQLVVFSQNHDQVGNRMKGERLSHLVSFEGSKLAAGIVLLSPFLPLLFMGEEYGEDAPFQYFVSHTDPDLVEAVRRGRREEFAAFTWAGEPPDPQSEETFERSKLNRKLRLEGRHRLLCDFHGELIRIRRSVPALALLSKREMEVKAFRAENLLYWRRWNGPDDAFAAFHFGRTHISANLPVPEGRWKKELHSGDERWGGEHQAPERLESAGAAIVDLAPQSFALFSRVM